MSPIFYLKINANTEFSIKCFEHWVEIVESFGSNYYVVCDNDDLRSKICCDGKVFNIISSSEEARSLLVDIVAPFWLSAGSALLTPFLHAKENGFNSFFNIDADDTVMCCAAELCVKALKAVESYADKTDVNCFSLDMHSSAFERFYPYWTFGVTYIKNDIDYTQAVSNFLGLKETVGIVDFFDENIDEVFSILGKYSIIKTGIFYIENLYFRHQNWEIHYYENGYFKYRNISNYTKVLWQIKDHELKNGIQIPKRFIKIDTDINQSDCITYLNNSNIFNEFVGNDWTWIDINKIKSKLSDGITKLVLFGAGKDGCKALFMLRKAGCDVAYFCDNSKKLWGTMVHKVEVISFEQLQKLNLLYSLCIVITSILYQSEIKQQLHKNNIDAFD